MDSIIFDLDGTLWDATANIAKAWDEAVREHTPIQISITRETLAPQLGKLLPDIMAAVFPDQTPEYQEYLLDLCCSHEHELLRQLPAPIYEGLEETLQLLSEKYRLFIVSNCEAGYIEVFLEASGLGSYFSGHLCPGDTGNAKAANIREVVETYQLQSPLYVGDTNGDENAAKKAGVPFVWAAYGLGTARKPAATIQDIRELPACLEHFYPPEK